jgi:hypothetical protein
MIWLVAIAVYGLFMLSAAAAVFAFLRAHRRQD